MARPAVVSSVTVGQDSGLHRASASIDGRSIFFECRESALDASPEAFASAILLPATERRRRTVVTDPVSPSWLENVQQMMAIWREWWGYRHIAPRAPTFDDARPQAAGVALCFTGGVDSFHTLLCGEIRPDMLVFVHGYDIRLDDVQRLAAWEAALREIAAEVSARPLVVRSNLRAHPLVAGVSWWRSHGGALAAIGHLLAPSAGTLLIASSVPTHYPYQWGSHSRLDPLWSSDRLRVVHHGATHSRVDKLREIAGYELVRRHLRVCWENRSATGNCSQCDKCLCTMATIVASGGQEGFFCFDWPALLAERLDELRETRFIFTYRELLDEERLSPRLARSIRALVERGAGVPYRSHAPFFSKARWRAFRERGGT